MVEVCLLVVSVKQVALKGVVMYALTEEDIVYFEINASFDTCPFTNLA